MIARPFKHIRDRSFPSHSSKGFVGNFTALLYLSPGKLEEKIKETLREYVSEC